MLKIDASNVIYSIVQQELVGKGRDSEALYVNLDLRLNYIIDNRTIGQSRGLHLLYQLTHGYSYITVFSGMTDSPFGKLREVKDWKHETTHDSCWRDIQTFANVYFDMADKVNAELVEQGYREVAPITMNEWHSFRGCLYQWVPIKVTRDSEDKNNYRRKVELVEKVLDACKECGYNLHCPTCNGVPNC